MGYILICYNSTLETEVKKTNFGIDIKLESCCGDMSLSHDHKNQPQIGTPQSNAYQKPLLPNLECPSSLVHQQNYILY